MRKILLLSIAVISFVSLPVYAEEWKFFVNGSGGTMYYKDMQKKNDILDFWFKTENDSPEECSGTVAKPYSKMTCDKLKEEKSGVDMSKMQIDCSQKKYREISGISYNYNGKVLENSDTPTVWRTIFPDTNLELLLWHYCSKKKK